ncbi:hypothetical protein [Chamaesiphon sp. VAR_48_metabat_403]|uniref:hypothetical protein n=1 Tax=Chamaesiphon sp. VAR_48_metabat_403 TaxID=2964700 RepID=UPI00286E3A05|nr:hypothetical protein [Chamaesiphon sp. VAR_48_metabat_403]
MCVFVVSAVSAAATPVSATATPTAATAATAKNTSNAINNTYNTSYYLNYPFKDLTESTAL